VLEFKKAGLSNNSYGDHKGTAFLVLLCSKKVSPEMLLLGHRFPVQKCCKRVSHSSPTLNWDLMWVYCLNFIEVRVEMKALQLPRDSEHACIGIVQCQRCRLRPVMHSQSKRRRRWRNGGWETKLRKTELMLLIRYPRRSHAASWLQFKRSQSTRWVRFFSEGTCRWLIFSTISVPASVAQ